MFIQEGLEQLENLESINLAGNLFNNIYEFSKLKNIQSLIHLKLTDSKNHLTNPLCSNNKNFVKEIHKILPKLETIDGKYD